MVRDVLDCCRQRTRSLIKTKIKDRIAFLVPVVIRERIILDEGEVDKIQPPQRG